MNRILSTLLLISMVSTAMSQLTEPRTTPLQARRSILLPQNPRAAAYILRLLENEALVEIVRSEPVLVAMLEREHLDQRWREEALQGLVLLHQSDRATELLASLSRVAESSHEHADSVMEAQAAMLLAMPVAVLQQYSPSLEALVTNPRPIASQVGCAALIASGRSAPELASEHQEAISNLLLSVRLLAPKHRDTFFEVIAQHWDTNNEQVRQSAITAASYLRNRDEATVERICHAISVGSDIATAVAALQRMDMSQISEGARKRMACSLIALASATPPANRTLAPIRNAMELLRSMASELPVETAESIREQLDRLAVQQYGLRAPYERMAFEPNVLVVAPGQAIEILFTNDDDKPHNFLLIEPGRFEEVGLAAQEMAKTPAGQDKNFVPSDGVLFASAMISPDQVGRLSMSTPSAPGIYPFVCTFPGHWLKMYGAMVVTNDVAAYLDNHRPLPDAEQLLGKVTVRRWTYNDLEHDAQQLQSKLRSFERGRQLFSNLACVACHQIGPESLLSRNIGPDLTTVASKHKSPPELLREILEPSRNIDPKYASVIVLHTNGRVFRGAMISRNEVEMVVNEKPLINCEPIHILLNEIQEVTTSNVSPMPEGLLDTLHREEILDLLAYVFSGGNSRDALFSLHP